MLGFRDRVSILMYHRVLASPDPLRPGDIDATAFDWHLRLLARWFNVLPLREAAHRLREKSLPPRAVCITFDDGYADNATQALPLLQKHGLHATFFIATGYLNGGRMWNDTVIDAFARMRGDRIALTDHALGCYDIATPEQRYAAIKDVIGKIKYLPRQERELKTQALAAAAGGALPDDLMMTSSQVLALRAAGMEVGAHTMHHPILARTNPEDAEREIAGSRQALQALLNDEVATFAYPNGRPGRDYGKTHVDMVRRAGFEVAVSTAWGAARSEMDRFQLARIAPWDATPLRFGLRIARSYIEAAPTLL